MKNQNNFLPSVFFVTCPSGFEQALCEELEEIYTNHQTPYEVEIGSAGCYVTGSFQCGILANLSSFCASRVLYVAHESEVDTEEELFDAVCTIDWPIIFDVHKTFAVKSNLSESFLQNSMYLSLKVKDALCDTFTEKLKQRPNVELNQPDVKIYVRLVRNRLSVSIDTSGDPLFMRGYKKNSHEAPLKETLAASLLRISGWNKLINSILNTSEAVYFERATSTEPGKIPKQVLLSPFFMDPFCGSGTIAIEAALSLLQFNPNCNRSAFAFYHLFPQHQEEIKTVTEELRKEALARQKNIADVKKCIENYAKENHIEYEKQGSNFFPFYASDISSSALEFAIESAQKAGVSELIHFSCSPASESRPQASCGLQIINPPYGERMGAKTNLPLLYKTVGDTWKHHFPNWTAWILSSNEALTKSVGLRATRKFSVYNGNLECRFLQYVMYARQT